jgi:hypothetical protein
MAAPEETLRESPVDFDSAVAFALQPVMRRLIILYLVGTLLLPVGYSAFVAPTAMSGIIGRAIGLVVALVGATLLFAGLVGAVFKIVVDANILAARTE